MNGLALTVECDTAPEAARQRLEYLLGPATVVVRSGGEWVDEATGEVQDRLHLHWRLTEPTRDAGQHAVLKRVRTLAASLVGGDRSATPLVHPIRWPGSWHRKGKARIALILAETEGELDLGDALERLEEATGSMVPSSIVAQEPMAPMTEEGELRETAELVREITTGSDYHRPLVALAMRYLKGGMAPPQVVLTLRGLLLAVPDPVRDIKEGTTIAGRWQARFDDVPRAVSTATAKLGPETSVGPTISVAAEADWPEPIDFLADADLTGAPELRSDHLPAALGSFVHDTAERMGVDPAAVALAVLVTLAGVVHSGWRVQPKRNDDSWTEEVCLWGAIVGDPSILKTPVIKSATRPVDILDGQARNRHAEAMAQWRQQVAELKADKTHVGDLPPAPRLERYLVENSTVEALTEALRDDVEAKQSAPLGKVLLRQDEMSEWLANMDRYKAGGRGGGDRGAYLRLYNGGRFVVDRVGRGTFAISSWSACVIGGIQPEPIQRVAREAADDGLLQRFCYVVPARQYRGADRYPDVNAADRYAGVVTALATLRPVVSFPGAAPRRVLLDEAAHRYREEILNLAEAMAAMPDTSGRLKAAFGKWPGLYARIALLFQLIDIADEVNRGREAPSTIVLSAAVAERSARYMREVLLPHLLRAEAVMFSTVQSGHARWIAGFILAHAQPRLALRDVVRAYGPLKAPEQRSELMSVMQSLETMGWLRAEPQDNPARPPSAWAVNPLVHQQFAARAAAEREARQRARTRIAETVARIRGKGEQGEDGGVTSDNNQEAA